MNLCIKYDDQDRKYDKFCKLNEKKNPYEDGPTQVNRFNLKYVNIIRVEILSIIILHEFKEDEPL